MTDNIRSMEVSNYLSTLTSAWLVGIGSSRALIDSRPKRPYTKYPYGMTFTQANDWLSRNIPLL